MIAQGSVGTTGTGGIFADIKLFAVGWMSLMGLVVQRREGAGPVPKLWKLRVRGGKGSQKSCSPRESLGISHSPVTPGLCIYLPFRWLQNAILIHSGLLEWWDSGEYYKY